MQLAKMVQETNILRCYSCHIFQVHIVKKAKKWQCKICNEKQSIQHVYLTGSGEECRLQVQNLNFKENNPDQQDLREALSRIEGTVDKREPKSVRAIERPISTHSKWTKYEVPLQTKPEHTGLNDYEDVEDQLHNLHRNRNQQKQNVIPIRKHLKRKSYEENSGLEFEPNSVASQPSDKIFKPVNCANDSSTQKRSLRDIVKENRKITDKNMEKGVRITVDKSRLEEINMFSNIDTNDIDISKPYIKRKAIFETDYEDLDEILDF